MKSTLLITLLCLFVYTYDCSKINTPRVQLPWFENLNVNFTFEIIEGGCYTWSLSRDDIIDLEPLYDDSWGHCSRSARVSVSKACVPPGSVIILAEDASTGEILRGDVDIDKISTLKVMSTTWKLYLEEAPEAFEVVAYDDQGNRFSTLEGVSFDWKIENLGSNVDEDPLVKLVRWCDTDYEAPPGVTEVEALGHQSHSVLLYGQAIGESRVTVCILNICTDFDLQVVASVVLTPAIAIIAPGDTLNYRVVRARAGRLTIEDISETLYYIQVPETDTAILEDSVSLVRGTNIGQTSVHLLSGTTEVASATLSVSEPYSIQVKLRPSNFLISGEPFLIHSVLLDKDGHALHSGDQILIRLSVEGEANVDLLRSVENGTLTDAVAQNSGTFSVTARLHSIAGKLVSYKVEGHISAEVVDPLQIDPPELFVAWTDSLQEIKLKHRGGGNEPVIWSELENERGRDFSLTTAGEMTIRGIGDVGVRVQLKKYPHIKAVGRVWSAGVELVRVSSSGQARVGRPHHLHLALTSTHPDTGELYIFHKCNCGSFAVSLLEGPEPHNVTAANWIEPMDGACCVLECVWSARGVSTVRVSRGRAGDSARVAVRAAPRLLWPTQVAALPSATLPVIAEGESLVPVPSDSRVSELSHRGGTPPHLYPDVQLFTLKCKRKGESRQELTSQTDEERETVSVDAWCAPHVSRVRLEPSETPGNCSGGPKVWLRPNQEVSLKVTLLDAIGRELLDENGPKMSWDIEPHHPGLEYKATDRLFVGHHPEYAPVPVPYKFYQVVTADESSIGWTGVLKAYVAEASASIQAKVVAPLKIDPVKVNIAWEGDTVNNIATITGGSGRYSVESPKGVTSQVQDGVLAATVPGPGAYDLIVTDLCVQGETQLVEVHIEQVLSVEVSSPRALGVGSCVRVVTQVRGADTQRYVRTPRAPAVRAEGPVRVDGDLLCGLREGSAMLTASFAGVRSQGVEVLVFPPLEVVPSVSRVPPGARLQLRHRGGPPAHLATLQYRAVSGLPHVEVTSSGSVHGLSTGTAGIKLVALDIANVEMDSATSIVEVIPISDMKIIAATQSLLVGAPGPLWVQAGALGPAALGALQPPPRVTWSVRDAAAARLYTTHADDLLERSVAEGLSVRVVPLKPGVITIDVRVRNMGQVAETRSWDSTIEILGISDIRTAVEGLRKEFSANDRLAIAVSSVVKLKSLPRSSWKAYEDGAFSVSSAGEVTGIRPGHGVIVAQHKDEKNNIYRETTIHVQVSVPAYCTAEPAGEVYEVGGLHEVLSSHEAVVRLVLRDEVGRPLLAPHANVTALAPRAATPRPSSQSALGTELVLAGLEQAGTFMSFQASVSGVTVKDEVWVTGSDQRADRVVVTGGWGVCLDGSGWRGATGVSLCGGAGVTLALLLRDVAALHVLRRDRPQAVYTLHQIPLDKMEFLPGEWPPALIPLSFTAGGLTSGPIICSEEQRYALEGAPIELPYICRTKSPHVAEPVLDIVNGHIGCKIITAGAITESSEVELCAEWTVYRTCTKVLLMPQIRVSTNKISLLKPPAVFTVSGHPHAIKLVRLSPSPGLKIDTTVDNDEISVIVSNAAQTCGLGWVSVRSKLTSQELRVDVQRECDVACGTLLGALLALLRPYLSTVVTVLAVAAAWAYVQSRLQRKGSINMPKNPEQTVLPPESPPTINRSRTWSRSPYAANGPAAPVYGDASMQSMRDQSFSPNATRNSMFL